MKLLAAFMVLAISAASYGDSEAARLARKARKAESNGDLVEAFLLYTQASHAEPGNKSYRAKASRLSGKAVASPSKISDRGASWSPSPDVADFFDSPEVVSFSPPAALKPRQGRFDINLAGDYKSLFDQVARFFQLDCVFDSDYEPGRLIHLSLNQADYRDALNSLAAITGSFVVPVSDRVFLVAKDQPQKRTDLEQSMSVNVPIPQYITTQELIEIAQAVRQASGVEKLAWDNKTGSIVMRDRVSRVLPAQEIFYDLFAHRPQVMIDLQLIELSHSDIVNFGASLPNLFNIAFTGLVKPGLVHGRLPSSLSLYTIGISAANALVNFSDSRGKTILTQNLRSVDAQPATFHYGQRYPILTGSYSAGTSVGTQYTPTPSFTFEDLGVTLKVTPHIHGMESVTLDVESEFKLLSGASNNGNPIISNRKLKSSVLLNNEEWAIISGLSQDSDARTVAGTAGVSSTPVFSQIFSKHKKDKESSEVLILMRSHLLSLPGNQNVPKDVWVGTETRPHTSL